MNLGQLNAQADFFQMSLEAQYMAFSQGLDGVNLRIDDVEEASNGGIAAAMALSSIPQARTVGKTSLGGGIATWRGSSAFSIGGSHAFESATLKFGATFDDNGNGGASAGFGFEF